MKITKEIIEELYTTMSIAEIATRLGMARSTLYYHMKKLGVDRRSKRDAQVRHLKNSKHQRQGKTHSNESKEKISDGARRFWDSADGLEQKQRLGDLRRTEWQKRSSKQRAKVLGRLQSAERPTPGELSRFGVRLVAFLAEREKVQTGIRLTPEHVSDIILEDRKVVIELLLPIAVYGNEPEHKISVRYDRLVQRLNDAGYRVMIIEDRSNTISRARCQRVYDALLKFFQQDTLQRLTIIS